MAIVPGPLQPINIINFGGYVQQILDNTNSLLQDAQLTLSQLNNLVVVNNEQTAAQNDLLGLIPPLQAAVNQLIADVTQTVQLLVAAIAALGDVATQQLQQQELQLLQQILQLLQEPLVAKTFGLDLRDATTEPQPTPKIPGP